jgi:hypothetical protein
MNSNDIHHTPTELADKPTSPTDMPVESKRTEVAHYLKRHIDDDKEVQVKSGSTDGGGKHRGIGHRSLPPMPAAVGAREGLQKVPKAESRAQKRRSPFSPVAFVWLPPLPVHHAAVAILGPSDVGAPSIKSPFAFLVLLRPLPVHHAAVAILGPSDIGASSINSPFAFLAWLPPLPVHHAAVAILGPYARHWQRVLRQVV